ncbi:sensor protein KdpD [Singulisphaera acidiphila]|uniref:Osmosensitive K+ channel His kinase sensor n=1 Tax=Singulisphaera acidiphila (strain ATCC BAA-1392 / DSM 18658 / VKM B-2454 / MOB10) TaxID=886293 RepID=L0DJW0_SINAD|nr:universal stress protein [Singulisphaera acidiphila]AGA29679.1 osmosensitive K+ channel His kinase sensor [Singulisphaera acidiphila DSM 18658]
MSTLEPGRPSPEHFLNLIRRQERGRLKVYLGSAAGVGKTYSMLREGQRLKKQGVDVAIGIVETHGRVETAEQLGDLEIIPPVVIEYRGVTLREMDLDGILARRPTVCLVDELAHTNAPGSRHGKRYQDVEELLRVGIHVITTVNIQHLESLYDEVERVTGVKVKERLPDSVLGEADQIVNVDISAEDLLERLNAGKVYPPERAERALENFFTSANLTRLREFTLAEMAHLIDRRTRRTEADRSQASATERVMVGMSSRSPNAPALMRKAARLADRLNAPWYAVYIQTPAEDLTRIDAATQRVLGKNLELAQQLGGIPMTFRGKDVASTISAFAHEYGIKVIIVGKTNQPWHRRLLRGSILEQILNQSEGVDVMVVDV